MQPNANKGSSQSNAAVHVSAQKAMVQKTMKASVEAQTGQVQDVCPITLETAHELGKDAFYSVVDGGRLYSGPALKDWLQSSSSKRLLKGIRPAFESPITRKDMARDAQTLGLSQSIWQRREPMIRSLVVAAFTISAVSLVINGSLFYFHNHSMWNVINNEHPRDPMSVALAEQSFKGGMKASGGILMSLSVMQLLYRYL